MITFSFALLLAASIAVFAGVNAQSGTPVTCTLTLAGGKTTYTQDEFVNYTYTCSRTTSSVTVQVVKPDSTITTYNTGYNITTSTLGFGTSNLVPGSYTLRICIEKTSDIEGTSCPQESMVSVPFTVVASPDTPPVITLSVNTANPAVSGYRPGVRAYYSMTLIDDKELHTVMVSTSQMMYSASTNQMFQCQGKTFCEEKVYIIVPSNPGEQFVTVTAIDSAGQVSTQTVTFEAVACVTDADCGTSNIQWAGASYCGSEASSGLETDIMQYGVAGACKSGGICDTASLPRVKQKCASGQVCTFGQNGVNLCIAQPTECIKGAQITSVCTCGNFTLNYPYDWRASNTPTYCCANNNGSSYTQSGAPCPTSCKTETELKNDEIGCTQRSGFWTERYQEGSCTQVRCNSTPPLSLSTSGSSVIPSLPASTQPFAGSPSVHDNSGSLSPTIPSVQSTIPTVQHPSALQKATGESTRILQQEHKKPNVVKVKKELQLLKNYRKKTNTKIKYIEKKIASFEKKIDMKLQLIDRLKKATVSKRAHAQIDRWEKKILSLEERQEKLELTADAIEASIAEFEATAKE